MFKQANSVHQITVCCLVHLLVLLLNEIICWYHLRNDKLRDISINEVHLQQDSFWPNVMSLMKRKCHFQDWCKMITCLSLVKTQTAYYLMLNLELKKKSIAETWAAESLHTKTGLSVLLSSELCLKARSKWTKAHFLFLSVSSNQQNATPGFSLLYCLVSRSKSHLRKYWWIEDRC